MSSNSFEFENEEKESYYSEVIVKELHFIKKIPMTIGIIIILLGIINMIIFFVIPIHAIKTNKRKLSNYSFKTPNTPIIVIHFILHILLILVGVLLVLFSLKNFDNINEACVKTGLIITCILTVFTWFVEIGFNISFTDAITSKMTVKDLISILSHDPPVDFFFIYSEDEVKEIECSEECEEKTVTCYSKTGVKIPVISKITSPIYNFNDVPELFYFNIEQETNLTLLFSSYFVDIMNAIKSCDPDTKKVIDFYPLIKGTYVVSMGKIPRSLTKNNKNCFTYFWCWSLL